MNSETSKNAFEVKEKTAALIGTYLRTYSFNFAVKKDV